MNITNFFNKNVNDMSDKDIIEYAIIWNILLSFNDIKYINFYFNKFNWINTNFFSDNELFFYYCMEDIIPSINNSIKWPVYYSKIGYRETVLKYLNVFLSAEKHFIMYNSRINNVIKGSSKDFYKFKIDLLIDSVNIKKIKNQFNIIQLNNDFM